MRRAGVPKLTAALLICAGLAAAGAPAIPDDERAIVHVLNRLGYGPRPGDVAAVRTMGVAAWIERQLHPDRIDDATLESRLADFTTLTLDSRTIVQEYRPPGPRRAARAATRRGSRDAAARPVSRDRRCRR